jgi:hypothetical protein
MTQLTTEQSQTTRLTSPTHSYTDSHQDSPSQSSLQPPLLRLRRTLNHRLNISSFLQNLSLCFCRLHKYRFSLTNTFNIPPFPNFPKTIPRESFPNFSTESSSRQHKSSQVERLGSLREFLLFIYLRTT